MGCHLKTPWVYSISKSNLWYAPSQLALKCWVFFCLFVPKQIIQIVNKKIFSVSKGMRRICSGPRLKMQAQNSLLNLDVMWKTGHERRRNQGQFLMQASSFFRSQAAADRGWRDLISMKSGGSVGRGALRISRLLYRLCPTYLNPQLPALGPAWTRYI